MVGQALPGWLILLLNHTPRNIIHILGPLDRGQQPLIQRALEGRHFFGVGFLGEGTHSMANIIVETYSQKCDVCSSVIRQRLKACDPMGCLQNSKVSTVCWTLDCAITTCPTTPCPTTPTFQWSGFQAIWHNVR